jgi:hypothetical protein
MSAEIEIVAVATSMDLPVASVARSYTVSAPAQRFEEALREGALYTLDVPVKNRGAYQNRVAVRDTATGKVGSASQFLEIPELKKGRVTLTSVILQAGDRQAGAPAFAGMSPVTRRFHPARSWNISARWRIRKENAAANLNSKIRIVRDGRNVYTGPAKLVPIDGGGLAFKRDAEAGRRDEAWRLLIWGFSRRTGRRPRTPRRSGPISRSRLKAAACGQARRACPTTCQM